MVRSKDSPGRRCFICLPYNDGWLIAAQILSVYATALSWLFVGTLALSMVTMIVFQALWFCRFPRGALYCLVAMAVLGSNAALGLGLYATYEFRNWDVVDCEPLSLYVRYDWNTIRFDDPGALLERDRCHEGFWMAVAYTSAILWGLAAGCLARFVTSGNHAAWEQRHDEDGDDHADTKPEHEALMVATESSPAAEETINV